MKAITTKNLVVSNKAQTLPAIQEQKKGLFGRSKVIGDELDVSNLVKKIANYHQNPHEFKGVIRNWFGRKKIESSERKLDAINSFMLTAQSHCNSVTAFKASLLSSQQELQALVISNTLRLEHNIKELTLSNEIALLRLDDEKKEIADDAEEREVTLALKQEELATMIAERQSIEARNEQERAKADIIRLKGGVIQKCIDDIDFKDVNIKQVLVVTELLKNTTTAANKDDLIMADIKARQAEAEISKMEEEKEMMREKRVQEGHQTTIIKASAEKTVQEWEDEDGRVN